MPGAPSANDPGLRRERGKRREHTLSSMNSALLQDCLRRLVPHVDVSRIGVTGGVAIGLHLDAAHGDRTRGLASEDVDFVAERPDAVRETVTTDFLVSHFHLPQPGYPKFLIQLVDPLTRLRLDIFPDTMQALSRAVDVAGVPLLVLRPDDILDHKLATLSKASPASPANAKHYADARNLGAICGRDVPPIAAACLTVESHSRDVGQTCARCEVSRRSEFPLASKEAILGILGYV